MTDLVEPYRLELRGIRKTYPAVVANDDISLSVSPGEIHAILGENGAGKSTLMKVIYGVVAPDQGQILWQGKPVRISSPAVAQRLGIGMVFQHFSLFESLTAAQNIALGMPERPELFELSRRIVEVSERYGLPVDPDRSVLSLSVGERQRVEIVRCLLLKPRLLIMDEPTSVLTPQAVRKMFETLKVLSAEGCSILYISHKLDEVQELCHSATVIRAGRVISTCNPAVETAESIARMMVGGELPEPQSREERAPGEPRLVVSDLTVEATGPFSTKLDAINLTVRSGEILGIAGVSGNGQQELLWALSGEKPLDKVGVISIEGNDVSQSGPLPRRHLGLCFVPEERLGRGAVPDLSLSDNALLTAHAQGMISRGLVRSSKVEAFAQRCIAEFDVRCGGVGAVAKSLSGGNLQKYIVGREILQQPRLLIVSQPTWGVDIGAAAFIRQTLVRLRNAGAAILLISEELDELFEISDNIAVIEHGRLTAAVPVSKTTREQVGLAMTGKARLGAVQDSISHQDTAHALDT